jgi:hypothetical protein
MNDPMLNSQTKRKNEDMKSKSGLYIIIILAAIIIALGWLFISSRSKVHNLTREKESIRVELQGELDSLMREHEMVKQEYGELVDTLALKDSVITANAGEITKLLNTQWEYFKVKKKLEQLRVITQGYVKQIDSLYQVNQVLQEENITIRRDLQAEQKKSTELTKDKESLTQKITEAAVLQAYNVIANGIRFRGANDEKVTAKAGKIDKIKICYTLGENKLLPPGMKNIYIRIAQPDNMILVKGKGEEYSFIYKGERLQYSILEQVDYLNQTVNVCSYWTKNPKETLTKGKYVVTLFSDDEEIGQTLLTIE